MMKFTSELNKFNAESMFTWTIGNLKEINMKSNRLVIKSKEIEFKEANASWFLKALPCIHCEKSYMAFKFYLSIHKHDENAIYNFKITDLSGTVLESHFFNYKMTNSNDGPIEAHIGRFISIDDKDSVEFTACVSMSTLVYGHKEPYIPQPIGPKVISLPKSVTKQEAEKPATADDFKHLPEIEEEKEEAQEPKIAIKARNDDGSPATVGKEMAHCHVCHKNYDDSYVCVESTMEDNEEPKKEKKDMKKIKIANMDDNQVSEVISNIYLENMREIAYTSGCLFVSAAQNKHRVLTVECCNSLAAQLNLKNFNEIWEVACKYNLENLKHLVIKFFAKNRDKICYNENISSELMFNVMKGIN